MGEERCGLVIVEGMQEVAPRMLKIDPGIELSLEFLVVPRTPSPVFAEVERRAAVDGLPGYLVDLISGHGRPS